MACDVRLGVRVGAWWYSTREVFKLDFGYAASQPTHSPQQQRRDDTAKWTYIIVYIYK